MPRGLADRPPAARADKSAPNAADSRPAPACRLYASHMSGSTPTRPDGAASKPPAVLDIEASGFGQDSYPIEIGFVLADGQTYCSLIRPAPGWTHWDAQAEHLHQIARETAVTHGRDLTDVAQQLNQRLRGLTLYCDGWAHDYVWLNVLFEAAGLRPSFKLDNLRALLTEPEAAAWVGVKRQVSAEMQLERHRASADATVLQQTLIRLRTPQARLDEQPVDL
jgi:3' exoribonuclease, RNase T-like